MDESEYMSVVAFAGGNSARTRGIETERIVRQLFAQSIGAASSDLIGNEDFLDLIAHARRAYRTPEAWAVLVEQVQERWRRLQERIRPLAIQTAVDAVAQRPDPPRHSNRIQVVYTSLKATGNTDSTQRMARAATR